ncbi:MAG: hypothetical protein LBM68_04190, partial [Bacteroidales bacterium]|nr:hypothetical protein [Bacteroidales bacterium]
LQGLFLRYKNIHIFFTLQYRKCGIFTSQNFTVKIAAKYPSNTVIINYIQTHFCKIGVSTANR